MVGWDWLLAMYNHYYYTAFLSWKQLILLSRNYKVYFLVIPHSLQASLDAAVWSRCFPAGEMADQQPVRELFS